MDRISVLQKEISDMRKALNEKEIELYELQRKLNTTNQVPQPVYADAVQYQYDMSGSETYGKSHTGDKLPRWAIERYSRQILLPNIGVEGQAKLCAARVLIVGVGGLGCPASSYLAGAGVGEIGLVDYDTVELTNLHRQLLHGEADQYMNKVDSAANALRRINSNIKVIPYNLHMGSSNALEVVSGYDLVLDCTDNVPTRYMLNDVCILLKIPLISGSALKMEGQLTIYGYRADKHSNEKAAYRGPCYRCVFARPPPAAAAASCARAGVAGPACGALAALQALEALKCLVGTATAGLLVGRMLLLDGEDATVRTVKLRARNPECAACSDTPTITQLLDYESFCRTKAKEQDLDLAILPPENRIAPKRLAAIIRACAETNPAERHLLVDVRTEAEFNMCRIDGAVNFPVDDLPDGDKFEKLLGVIKKSGSEVTFVCRRGNDSQIVAQKVMESLQDAARVKDLSGGLHAWSREVDNEFPIY